MSKQGSLIHFGDIWLRVWPSILTTGIALSLAGRQWIRDMYIRLGSDENDWRTWILLQVIEFSSTQGHRTCAVKQWTNISARKLWNVINVNCQHYRYGVVIRWVSCTFLLCTKNSVSANLTTSSSSRMRVMNHNWSVTKQRLHPQSVAEISRHSVINTHAELITPAVYLYSCLATVIRQSTFRA